MNNAGSIPGYFRPCKRWDLVVVCGNDLIAAVYEAGIKSRIVVMEFGTRLIEGTPAEVQASPAVRAAYLGTEH